VSDVAVLGMQIGRLLARAHHRASREFAEALASTGIDGRLYGVLSTVGRLGPSTQTQLVAETGADKSAMMRTVDELEGRGLVERQPVAGDRRIRMIVLTDAGRACLAEADGVARAVAGRLFGDMTAAELTALRDALQKFSGG
jgi:MarR family transcriptional regulator, lower aerobic nicotinate degradation pathway regulator